MSLVQHNPILNALLESDVDNTAMQIYQHPFARTTLEKVLNYYLIYIFFFRNLDIR